MRYTPMRCKPMRHTPVRYMPMRCTPMRCTPLKCTPVRCTFIRYTPMRCTPAHCCVQAAFRWRFAGSYTTAGQEPAISHETGTRQKGVSYVYKYQLATQIE